MPAKNAGVQGGLTRQPQQINVKYISISYCLEESHFRYDRFLDSPCDKHNCSKIFHARLVFMTKFYFGLICFFLFSWNTGNIFYLLQVILPISLNSIAMFLCRVYMNMLRWFAWFFIDWFCYNLIILNPLQKSPTKI